MRKLIEDDRITSGDFAYLCGSLVVGLWVGNYTPNKNEPPVRRALSLGTSDYSYASYVGNIIKRLTHLNPSVKEYTYKTKIDCHEYNNPRSVMTVNVPAGKKDFFLTLLDLKGNLQKLNELILNSSKRMQGRFLQAVMDARATPVVASKCDLDISLHASYEKQFPIITSVLDAYGIAYVSSPKVKPTSILIKKQKDVNKIIKKIGFNSERVKSKVENWVKNLYNIED